MSTQNKVLLGGLAALIVIWALPLGTILTWVLVLGLIGAPIAGYLMLDPSQRRRLRESGRKRLGP